MKKVLIDGQKAFEENNFDLAKNIYTEAVKSNPKYRDFWYNLGASELELGENENACEHFYQAFLLNDGEALLLIKKHCPNFRNGTIMSIDDVEEKPKFIYKEKEYPLFDKNGINPKFTEILARRFKSSRLLYDNYRGHLYVKFEITRNDSIDLKVFGIQGDDKKVQAIKDEVKFIFNDMVKYVSAKNKGVNVELWEKWTLPITSK